MPNLTLKLQNLSLYLSEFKTNGKYAQRKSVQEELHFFETAKHGSSLGRNRFGTKIGNINKHCVFQLLALAGGH